MSFFKKVMLSIVILQVLAGGILALLTQNTRLGQILAAEVGGILLLLCFRYLLLTFFSNIFSPGDSYNRAQPAYGPALTLKNQERYQEAIQALTELAAAHPGLARPYIEMMYIRFDCQHNFQQCQQIYQEALPKVRRREEKKLLQQTFQEISSEVLN